MHRGHSSLIVLAAVVLIGLALCLLTTVGQVQAQAGCTDLIGNGGFESGGVWQFGPNLVPAQYINTNVHTGSRALQLGIVSGANLNSFSSARQTVNIPATADRVTLSFWFYTVVTAAPTADYLELVLLAPDGFTVLDKVWYSQNDSRTWNQLAFDLTRWRGQTVQVYFNVYNDGAGGTASMLVDDVTLVQCAGTAAATTGTPTLTRTPTATPSVTPIIVLASHTPTATPTHTPVVIVVTATQTPVVIVVTATHTPVATPTQTPVIIVVTATQTPGVIVVTATPGPPPVVVTPIVQARVPPGCVDLLRNGSFEEGFAGWWPAPNKLPVTLAGDVVHSGAGSAKLGTDSSNLNSYSSIRQQVTIPAGHRQVTLEFWTWTWAESLSGADHQEAALLKPDPSVIAKPWRALSNDRAWVAHTVPLGKYAGKTLSVYFNVVNDGAGGRTGMYLDDVHLWTCAPAYAGDTIVPAYPAAPVVVQANPVQAVVQVVVVTATPPPAVVVVAAAPAAAVVVVTATPIVPVAVTRVALQLTPAVAPTPTLPVPEEIVVAMPTVPAGQIGSAFTNLLGNDRWLSLLAFVIVVLVLAAFIAWLITSRDRGAPIP